MSAARRTPEQIREEIHRERARLDAAVAGLGTEARRSGRVAGSALAALASMLLVRKLRRHRRDS